MDIIIIIVHDDCDTVCKYIVLSLFYKILVLGIKIKIDNKKLSK